MLLVDLLQQVASEEDAFRFLQARGLMHRERWCANGHAMKRYDARYRCTVESCRLEVGVRRGTFLENAKAPSRDIVVFIYLWSQQKSSLKFVKEVLGRGHNFTVAWNGFLRDVLLNVYHDKPPIGGYGFIVEIDESLFGKRKHHRGRALPEQWVFGGICRETKEAFMVQVPDRKRPTLFAVIEEKIRPGTVIISDGWKAYRGIEEMGRDYHHFVVNHSRNFVDPETGAHTQTIERTWRVIKDDSRRRSGTHRSELDSYICESLWQSSLGDRNPFDLILEHIAQIFPPK